MNKIIRWNIDKAKQLEGGRILDIIKNPSINHPDQKIYVLEIEGYAYAVPFVESEEEVFLKTLFPSRKLTTLYLANKRP